MPIRVLFVCHGNICRSPMGQLVLQHMVHQRGMAEQFEIASAAVSREELGNPVYPPARKELARHGIDASGHCARQMTKRDYQHFDYILAADRSNLRGIERIAGCRPADKAHLLMAYAGEERDIADPWYTGDFETTYDDVVTGCQGFLEHVLGHDHDASERRM